MIAFVLASVYGGAAGVLYAGLIHYIAPETFSIADMFLLLAMVIIGGRQSLWGCVAGAIGLTIIRQELINLAAYAQLGYGLVVVAVVVFAPTGLAGVPSRVRMLSARRRAGASAVALGAFGGVPSSGRTGAVLEVSGLVMRFRGVTALDRVSLRASPGEILGIVGPNGSGKTTLFNVISGLYRPSAGRVTMDGRVISGSRHGGSRISVSPARSSTCGCSATSRSETTCGWRWTVPVRGGHGDMCAGPSGCGGMNVRWHGGLLVCWTRSGWRRSPMCCPIRCPTASSDGWRWRRRPALCCWTSPRRG
ncbi:MAG: ATP-binding cassette domain-containing protein [Streptosporangiaceae bacterium]|nr:ATP-binding cassette domain-containing protein [Streptosporangiaceae bacterium]